jgi:hypothetical protein
VAARSKAWTVFVRSNTGIVGSNSTQGMDVCVYVYSVFVLSCVLVAALRRADHYSKESHRLCKKDYETEEQARVQQRTVKPLTNEYFYSINTPIYLIKSTVNSNSNNPFMNSFFILFFILSFLSYD